MNKAPKHIRPLLLAIAGILSRLDEIAYNTRPLN